MYYAGDSPASPSARRASERGCLMSAGSGRSSPVSFAYLDRAMSWRRMSQGSGQLTLAERSAAYLQTWPKAGMMRNGIAYQRPPLVRRIGASASFSWPTPTAVVWSRTPEQHAERRRKMGGERRGVFLQDAVMYWPTPCASDSKGGPGAHGQGGPNLRTAVAFQTPTATDAKGRAYTYSHGNHATPSVTLTGQAGGLLNPDWVEWLMGFPIKWTASKL